jgi:hypothetical protein
VVTVKEPGRPSVKVAEAGEVNPRTDKVAFAVSSNPIPFEAANVTG